MAAIGFVGLGNMGGPMVRNLLTAGHTVRVFDLVADAVAAVVADGAQAADSANDCAAGAEVVISMLPAGQHVRAVYSGATGLIRAAAPGTLMIDCSTIDVTTARAMNGEAVDAGLEMLDAPVSGGVGGATNATLTFMVGGAESAFARGKPIFEAMGKTVIHAGGAGNGQVAKICNNMILGAHMIVVGEAFVLAEKLGLDRQKLYDISSKSTGYCWSLNDYCPVPGPVPTSPANRDYEPGFTAAMMLKDLKLAQEAAIAAGATTPLGAEAAALYGLFCAAGNEALDFSGIIKLVQDT